MATSPIQHRNMGYATTSITMKPIYRLTYLLLYLIGGILILLFALMGKAVWILTGRNPAMRWVDQYMAWLGEWKKGRGI